MLDSKASPPVTLGQNSDYTVTGGSGSTGSVILSAGGTHTVTVGDVITISRRVPLTQTVSFAPGGPFTPAIVGQAFDKLTMISQQLNLIGANSLQFQQDEQISGVMPLTQRKSAFLAFDVNGRVIFPQTASVIVTTTTAPLAVVNFAALRVVNVTAIVNGTPIAVGGHTTLSDGGGGVFVYTSASSLVDDDGAVVQPNGVSGAGRWIRQESKFINLVMFGCDPTAAVDCRNQFQRALNWCRRINATLIVEGDYRVASTLPLYIGKVNIRGHNGRIFNSLPDDYNWVTYGTDTYTANNVVDSTGALVTWNATVPSGTPWNGKTNMFASATQALIENLYIDAGWWATNANAPTDYPSAKSIRGIKGDGDEMTYYQVFAGSTDTTFLGCRIYNIPGACFETGDRISVTDCYFTDYGDHIFYYSGSAGLTFSGNQGTATRAASGSSGQRDYIYQTVRDTVKLRGSSTCNINDNRWEMASNACCFINLETNSAPGLGGDTYNIQVADNIVQGGQLFLLQSYRSTGGVPYGGDGVGYYIRDVKFSNNKVNSAGLYFGNFFQAAVQRVEFIGNTFTSTSTGQILFLPSPEYATPIRGGLLFKENTYSVTSGGIFPCVGNLWGAGTISFEREHYLASTLSSSNSLLNVGDLLCTTSEQHLVSFIGCSGINLFSFWVIGGAEMDWVATNDYTGFERTYADGAINRGSIALYSGTYYRARTDITGDAGNTNPSVDTTRWAVYSRQTTRIMVVDNTQTVTTNTQVLLYFLRQHLGFVATPFAAANRIYNQDGTLAQYLLKANTCLDTITNLSVQEFIPYGTPATSTDPWVRGMMKHDGTYIYIAYADSQIGRVLIDVTPFP